MRPASTARRKARSHSMRVRSDVWTASASAQGETGRYGRAPPQAATPRRRSSPRTGSPLTPHLVQQLLYDLRGQPARRLGVDVRPIRSAQANGARTCTLSKPGQGFVFRHMRWRTEFGHDAASVRNSHALASFHHAEVGAQVVLDLPDSRCLHRVSECRHVQPQCQEEAAQPAAQRTLLPPLRRLVHAVATGRRPPTRRAWSAAAPSSRRPGRRRWRAAAPPRSAGRGPSRDGGRRRRASCTSPGRS